MHFLGAGTIPRRLLYQIFLPVIASYFRRNASAFSCWTRRGSKKGESPRQPPIDSWTLAEGRRLPSSMSDRYGAVIAHSFASFLRDIPLLVLLSRMISPSVIMSLSSQTPL